MTKQQVPPELLYNIFEFLPHSSIVHGVGLVSKYWREFATSNRVWKSVRNNLCMDSTQKDIHERQEKKPPGYWCNLFKKKCHYICKEERYKDIQPTLLQSYKNSSKHRKQSTGIDPIYLSTKEAIRVFEPIIRRKRTEIARYGHTLYSTDHYVLYECDLGRMVILMIHGNFEIKASPVARYVVPRRDGVEIALGLDKEIDNIYKLKFKKYVNLADRKQKKANGRKK